MKKKVFALTLFVVFAGCLSSHGDDVTVELAVQGSEGQTEPVLALTGPYLGQAVPGKTAILFAPGVVSVLGRYEFALSFSPGGDRLLFTVQTADEDVMVMHMRQVDGNWTQPVPVSLAGGAHADEMEAFFSPDGKYVYFAPYDEGMDVRIWQVTVDGDDWTDPVPLSGAIAEQAAFFPTVTADGTLYYSNIAERHPYFSRQQEDGTWSAQPVAVDFGLHTFVAPDQSFLVMDARVDDSLGRGDIYVAFATDKGGWTRPVNLGPGVNSTFSESCPSLSADGKFLFFSRYDEEGGVAQIYWVDAEVIANARARVNP